MLILNEKKYAEELYNCQNNNIKSVAKKVEYITRYLYAMGYDKDDNYRETVRWMNKNHENFDESCYSNLIADAVKKAHKKPFFNMDNIVITKPELEVIMSLNNLRAEKVLFVLLCMAKQQRVSYGFTSGLVKYSLSDLCKMARISVPTEEREYILNMILNCGYLSSPKKNDTKCLIVNFIDDNSESELEINEIDCQELAYVYLNWKNNGNGYTRCELCGRLIKKSKHTNNRYCRDCSEIVGDISDKTKVIKCQDCGKLVYIDNYKNNVTYRCKDCQYEANKQNKREWKRKYDENKR